MHEDPHGHASDRSWWPNTVLTALETALDVPEDYDVAHISSMVRAIGLSPPLDMIAHSMPLHLASGKSVGGAYCYMFQVTRSTNRVRPQSSKSRKHLGKLSNLLSRCVVS
jgi:hypothetical protein